MFTRLAAASLFSALAGVGLGYALFHAESASELATATMMAHSEKENVVVSGRAATPTSPAPAPAVVRPLVATAPVREEAPVVAALNEKVQELERQLAIERAIRKGTEGERIEAPSNLPSRLRDEKLLLTTFNDALKAAGFPGQVSNIDCTEYPCIVFGTGFGDRDDMRALKGKLGAYEGDSFSTYGFGSSDGKKEHSFFGVAVMAPLKGPPDEAMQKRVSFRVNQMREASKPPAP
jgi:hypothetical protein